MLLKAICIASALMATAAIPASAAQSSEGRSVTVHYDDLNITNPKGAAVLINRIRYAAQAVCGPSPDMRNVVGWDSYRACLNETVSRALLTVNSATVSAAYQNGSGAQELVVSDRN